MGKVLHRPLPLEVPAQIDKLIDADIAHQLLTHYEAYVKEVGQEVCKLPCVLCTLLSRRDIFSLACVCWAAGLQA